MKKIPTMNDSRMSSMRFVICPSICTVNRLSSSVITYVFRKEKSRKAAKAYRDGQKEYVRKLENRNAILEYQNEAIIKELRTLLSNYTKKAQMNRWKTIKKVYFMIFFSK